MFFCTFSRKAINDVHYGGQNVNLVFVFCFFVVTRLKAFHVLIELDFIASLLNEYVIIWLVLLCCCFEKHVFIKASSANGFKCKCEFLHLFIFELVTCFESSPSASWYRLQPP